MDKIMRVAQLRSKINLMNRIMLPAQGGNGDWSKAKAVYMSCGPNDTIDVIVKPPEDLED